MLNILEAELIKLKNSSLIICIIMITIAPVLNGFSVSSKLMKLDNTTNSLETIYTFSVNQYTMLILPTIIILAFAITMRSERINGGMKDMLILPLTRSKVYFSKLIIGMSLVALSIISFLIAVIIGAILQGNLTVSDVSLIIIRIVKIFFASFAIMGIQFYLSINYEGVTVPLGIGFCFLIPSFLLSNSEYSIFYPSAYITTINDALGVDKNQILMLSISIIIFIILSLLGYKNFNKKDIY